METSGRLRIVDDVSSVGRALAIDGAPDALSAATQFVRARRFDDGDAVTVTGSAGQLGERPVIFMIAIRAQALAAAKGLAAGKARGLAASKKKVSGAKQAKKAVKKKKTARKKK